MCSRAALLEQAGKQQAAETTTAQYPTPNQQASETMLFTTAFVFAFVLIISLPAFPQKVRQQQIAHAPAAQHAAADQQSRDPLFVSAASFRAALFSITQQRIDRHGILLLLKLSAAPAPPSRTVWLHGSPRLLLRRIARDLRTLWCGNLLQSRGQERLA